MRVMVNLIPEARLSKLKQKRNKRVMTTSAIVLGITVGTIIGTLVFLLGANLAISKTNEATINKLKEDVAKKKTIELEASTLQEHLASFKDLNDNRLLVNKIFDQFGKTIQGDVKVQSFAVSADYTVTINGIAKSLRSVSAFDKAIEEYNVNFKPKSFPDYDGALFSDVKITSTSVSDDKDWPISFTMTFKANPEVFKRAGQKLEGNKQ